jgi:hypothetical protein
MNMKDYPTIHLDSNKKKVATFVLLFHEHLTWRVLFVLLFFFLVAIVFSVFDMRILIYPFDIFKLFLLFDNALLHYE